MNDALKKLVIADDGIRPCPSVGPWAETKYRFISLYAELFSTGMKAKWGKRVYIDLYAGAGYSQIHGTGTVLKGSPILALSVPNRFDKYIFCEEDPGNLNALKTRVQRMAPKVDASFVLGKCDEKIAQIRGLIPSYSQEETVL